MTIKQAIELVDHLNPNTYPQDLKVKWLAKLDGRIYTEILATHEGNPLVTEENPDGVFYPYNANTDDGTELLVPFPFDEDVYNYYLQSKINFENSEMGKYNQAVSLFNSSFQAFQDAYNRSHMPIHPEVNRFRF